MLRRVRLQRQPTTKLVLRADQSVDQVAAPSDDRGGDAQRLARAHRKQRRAAARMGKPAREDSTTRSGERAVPPLVRTLSKDIDRDEKRRVAEPVDDDDAAENGQVESEEAAEEAAVPPVRVRGVGHTTSEGSTGHANEDRFLVQKGPHFHLFAVIDGHGGDKAADFLVERLYEALEQVYKRSAFADKSEIEAAIEALDRTYLAISHRLRDDSGACLNAVVLYWDKTEKRHQKMVLNVGDCRAVAREAPERGGKRRGRASSWHCKDERMAAPFTVLSDDHCAANRSEKLRALNAGAFIRNRRIAGILEPFRSIGDLDMKTPGMAGWVISTPEIRVSEVQVGRTTIVLATDGVWSMLSNQRVMMLADQELQDGGDEQTAAEAIADEAREIGSSDDITVIVVSV